MLRLTEAREALGWSKSRLAREAKMTASTVGQSRAAISESPIRPSSPSSPPRSSGLPTRPRNS